MPDKGSEIIPTQHKTSEPPLTGEVLTGDDRVEHPNPVAEKVFAVFQVSMDEFENWLNSHRLTADIANNFLNPKKMGQFIKESLAGLGKKETDMLEPLRVFKKVYLTTSEDERT